MCVYGGCWWLDSGYAGQSASHARYKGNEKVSQKRGKIDCTVVSVYVYLLGKEKCSLWIRFERGTFMSAPRYETRSITSVCCVFMVQSLASCA